MLRALLLLWQRRYVSLPRQRYIMRDSREASYRFTTSVVLTVGGGGSGSRSSGGGLGSTSTRPDLLSQRHPLPRAGKNANAQPPGAPFDKPDVKHRAARGESGLLSGVAPAE